jgi:hypothetical protein
LLCFHYSVHARCQLLAGMKVKIHISETTFTDSNENSFNYDRSEFYIFHSV